MRQVRPIRRNCQCGSDGDASPPWCVAIIRVHSYPGNPGDEVPCVDLTPQIRGIVCDVHAHRCAGIDQRTTPAPMALTCPVWFACVLTRSDAYEAGARPDRKAPGNGGWNDHGRCPALRIRGRTAAPGTAGRVIDAGRCEEVYMPPETLKAQGIGMSPIHRVRVVGVSSALRAGSR
jgi:hypothetical protein